MVAAAVVVVACAGTDAGVPSASDSTAPPTTSFATSTHAPTSTVAATTTGAPATTVPSTPPPSTVTPGSEVVTLDVGPDQRQYVLFVPEGVPASEPAPLVIDIHGLGSNATAHDEASGFTTIAEREGIVVAQPEARGEIPTWNPQPGAAGMERDVAFLRAIVADVARKVAVDPGSVFVTGFSNGGGMAHRFACEAAELVAAIGTVSGQYQVADDCDPAEPVAVIAFHGTSDVVVPYFGAGELLPPVPSWAQDWADRNVCGPVAAADRIADDVVTESWSGCAERTTVVLYTVEDGAHAWPGTDRPGFFQPTQSIDATDLMWEFFDLHSRG